VQATIVSGLGAGLKQPHDDLKHSASPRSHSKPNGQAGGPDEDAAEPGPMSDADFDAEIQRLASLNRRQYERQIGAGDQDVMRWFILAFAPARSSRSPLAACRSKAVIHVPGLLRLR
jgi:hypothetical protein